MGTTISTCFAALLAVPALAAQQPTALAIAGRPTIWVRMDTVGTWVNLPGSTRDAFRWSVAAYKGLKIKAELADSLKGLIGNPGFFNTGAFMGRRMSSWIRCGEGLTGPNADTWRISMAILSGVERVGADTARIRTVVVASARNMAEGSSTPIMCATAGQIEHAINQKVLALATGQDSVRAEKKP